MKVKNKPLKRRIVVALLGMCVAVSSYTLAASEASTGQGQIAAGMPATTIVQSVPAPQDPFNYGYSYTGYNYTGYNYTGYGYTYYGYTGYGYTGYNYNGYNAPYLGDQAL